MEYPKVIAELITLEQQSLNHGLDASNPNRVSTILNSSKEYLYITNCKNTYNKIKFELMSSSVKQLIYVELDTSDKSTLFIGEEVNKYVEDATNFLLSVRGHFDKQQRDKFILYAMANNNVNLSLLTEQYLLEPKSKNILIYPNGVHNITVSTVDNEMENLKHKSKLDIVSQHEEIRGLYLALFNMYRMNAYEVDKTISILPCSLTEVNINKYDIAYVEHGNGFTSQEIEYVMECADKLPQLYIMNHKVLIGHSSSKIQMQGLITDRILDKLLPQVIKETIPVTATTRESSISTNPLE